MTLFLLLSLAVAAAVCAQTMTLGAAHLDLNGCVRPAGTYSRYQQAGNDLLGGERSCNLGKYYSSFHGIAGFDRLAGDNGAQYYDHSQRICKYTKFLGSEAVVDEGLERWKGRVATWSGDGIVHTQGQWPQRSAGGIQRQ
ncbi:hypothetical protein LTR35_013741 [Friedmanniomyces endolithicus]|nr:hypothetical protein LTR35_013741 [Friedmanniomyces endolithicus]KAK0271387.1 hypothetical protein LTS00_016637 [Friedmanniomyces endolithicus]KAK0973230.1 hypothetical protein LTR54_017386 [Friedmanniomyces endolithicus]